MTREYAVQTHIMQESGFEETKKEHEALAKKFNERE